METQDHCDRILTRLQQSLSRIELRAASLRKTDALMVYTSTITSVLATALAGLTAAVGPLMGEGVEGFEMTCWGVAVLTAVAGLTSGLHQRLGVAEQLANALVGVGKLRSLEIALSVAQRDPLEVAKEYEQFAVNYKQLML
jgi:hypothetical protein